MSSKMDDSGVCNKGEENKSKNDKNSGDKLAPLIIPDASAEPHRQAEMIASVDISEESRERFDGNVKFEPLNFIYFSILVSTHTV